MEKQKYLNNVAVIRPILIVLLVFYHAFAPYSGAWAKIDGYRDVPMYWWLDKLSYAFMLEMFVFLSGYLFGFQVRTRGRRSLEARVLFVGKFKRLIIPSVVFSFLYIVLLQDMFQPIEKTLYDVVNGVGHMWFLPMLYWCFVIMWIIETLQQKPRIVLPFLLFCSVISFIPLPLQLGRSMYYMLFFYVGYQLQENNINLDILYTNRVCLTLFLAFVVLFPLLTLLDNFFELFREDSPIVIKALTLSIKNFLRVIYASVGLAMLFVFVGRKVLISSSNFPHWIIVIGELCMGVYLFQQFILKFLYNSTALPYLVGPYWLPWIGFVLTLAVSSVLSFIFRFTKLGRLLIG